MTQIGSKYDTLSVPARERNVLMFNSLTAKEGVDYPKGLRLLSRYTKNRLAICKKSNNLENVDELAHFLLNSICRIEMPVYKEKPA